jgi:orotate phosphoribosyltransferase
MALTTRKPHDSLRAMDDHQRLTALLAERSARRGQFTLASGRVSTLYIDARMTTMSPEGLPLIGRLGLAELSAAGWDADAIGGLTLGADPISYAISYASSATAKPLRAFTVRKAPKSHGTAKLIEGPFNPGDHVVVIEDVITTGGSALKAISAVRDAGGKILGLLALVDREEGGREAIEAEGVAVRVLTPARRLLTHLQGNPRDLQEDGTSRPDPDARLG